MKKFTQILPSNCGISRVIISNEQCSAIDKKMMTVNEKIRYKNAVAALNAQRICINR